MKACECTSNPSNAGERRGSAGRRREVLCGALKSFRAARRRAKERACEGSIRERVRGPGHRRAGEARGRDAAGAGGRAHARRHGAGRGRGLARRARRRDRAVPAGARPHDRADRASGSPARASPPIAKMEFSACDNPAFERASSSPRVARAAIVRGHGGARLRVPDRARARRARVSTCIVPIDGVASRSDDHRAAGLESLPRRGRHHHDDGDRRLRLAPPRRDRPSSRRSRS